VKSQMMFYAKVASKENTCGKKEKGISSFETKDLRRVSERIMEKNYRELVEYHKRQYSNE